jgi:sortase (surface protein transpeptidase)
VLAVGAGSLWFGSSLADQTIVPIGAPGDVPVGTPSGTPGADCLFPATPSATPAVTGTPVACARGAVPVHIRIDEIDVDAEMEILETVGGVMQAPTGAEDVAWYKESARLGETGNILLAGHLNYWGVPEGVFFRLEALAEGDAVEIEGDDGETYRYIVEWAENFPSDEEPPEEALGHTSNQSLTLITCGGEWNIDMAEYDHRTVVRAVRDTEASAGAPVATPGS